MNIVILAAGMGKRMHSGLPKVLQPVAARPMISRVVETAEGLGEGKVVVVIGHGGELVRERLAGDPRVGFALQPEQLGTGDALRCALPLLDESDPKTLVLLGDVPLIRTETLSALCREAEDGIGLLTVNLGNPTGYGRIVKVCGSVRRIVEEKDATPEEKKIREVNTGIMVLPTRRLRDWAGRLTNENAQGEFYLTDFIGFAAGDGVTVRSTVAADPDEVMGVNSKRELAAAERAFQRREAEKLLDAGVTLADPARIDVRGMLECGQDVSIDVGCVFEGHVKLGNRVRIGAYCVLRDTEVANDTEILAFTHSDGASVGEEARIGPFTRLRPGAQLGRETHVGNFCEIKKSTIGTGSKVNHLSYIGDTTMGAHVNIGAGTITCNYDGVNKFRTEIGDDAFIGSDTQLVAPVSVGRGATLGAGTTLTRNAPEGKLTLSRARQVTVEGWQRPQKKASK